MKLRMKLRIAVGLGSHVGTRKYFLKKKNHLSAFYTVNIHTPSRQAIGARTVFILCF